MHYNFDSTTRRFSRIPAPFNHIDDPAFMRVLPSEFSDEVRPTMVKMQNEYYTNFLVERGEEGV